MAEEIEQPEMEGAEETAGNAGNLLSPEAVIMLSTAATLDLISLIPVLNVATGILGTIIIGSWMYFRSGATPEKPQRPGKIKPPKGGSKAFRRLTIGGIIETIPIISMLPWWTITVWNELKS